MEAFITTAIWGNIISVLGIMNMKGNITRRSSVQIRLPQPEGKTWNLRVPSLFLLGLLQNLQNAQMKIAPKAPLKEPLRKRR